MTLNPLLLSRLQFAWVIAWHILLPAFTVGLAAYVAFLEGAWFFTGKPIWLRLSTFWTKLFSVSFGMGVVSGIVMPFQIGTNWSRFLYATSDVISPLLGYEGFMAFILEASFLGILLFGRKLVPPWTHFVAALMVSLGTLFSGFWILSANSWMQTPSGAALVNGRFVPQDWLAIIFNPAFPTEFGHTIIGFFVTTGFVVLSVAAGYLLHGRFVAEARRMLSTTLWLLLVLVPLQIWLGDASGLVVKQYQPPKLAAIEAIWDTGSRLPWTVFAIPDENHAVNHDAIEIPDVGSLILTHRLDGTVQGLKDFPREDWPPVMIPFFAFRIMAGIGFLMLAIILAGNLLRTGERVFANPFFLRVCQWGAPLGFIAVIAGWSVTEVGRQPWTVYGLLRTAHSVTPSLTGWNVLLTLLGYALAYLIIFPGGLLVMIRIVRRGPTPDMADDIIESGRPRSPVRPVAELPGDGGNA